MIRTCYAKLQGQATDDTLSAQFDARPGGHAKWVRIPRGLATVSGERHVKLAESSHWVRLRSEEHTSELQSQSNLVCRLLLEKKKKQIITIAFTDLACETD